MQGLGATAAVALLIRILYGPPCVGYDAWFALAWGRDLVHGVKPDFGVPIAPTPHPLANLVSALVSPLGHSAPTAIAVISVLSFAVLGVALFVLTSRLFGLIAGLVAAVVILTRPLLVGEMLYCSVDIPFLALVACAGAVLVGPQRRPRTVLALLLVAGLLRPEGWLLGVAAAAVFALRGNLSRRTAAALAVAAPLLWMVSDWIIAGDPLHSLHGTQDLAAELGRPRSTGTAIRIIPVYIRALLGNGIAWASALAALAALWFALERAALPLAVAALGLLGFLVLGVADLPLLYRYMLLPATALAMLFGFGVTWWRELTAQRRLQVPMIGLAVACVVLALSNVSADRNVLLGVKHHNTRLNAIQADLAALVRRPATRAQLAACPHAASPSARAVPELAYLLGVATAKVHVAGDAPLREPGFSPVPGEVAAAYALTPADRLTFSVAQVRGRHVVTRNESWVLYGARDCAPA